MNGAADDFELRAIVRRDCCCSLCLELANTRFDAALVYADDGVMLLLNAKSICEGCHEVFLVHLRVALYELVTAALCHLTKFCECFVSQLFVCQLCHGKLLLKNLIEMMPQVIHVVAYQVFERGGFV